MPAVQLLLVIIACAPVRVATKRNVTPGAVAGHDQVAVRHPSESADQPGGERGRGVGLGRHSGGGEGLGQEVMNRDGNKNIYLTIYILKFGGKR